MRRREDKTQNKGMKFKLHFLIILTILLYTICFTGFLLSKGIVISEKLDFEISMTEDLNADKEDTRYRLTFNWIPKMDTNYEYYKLKIGQSEYIIEPDISEFEVEVTSKDDVSNLKFQSKESGKLISIGVNKSLKLFDDNTLLEQFIENIKIDNHYLSFEHEIKKIPNRNIDVNSIQYQAFDAMESQSLELESEVLSDHEYCTRILVKIPMNQLLEYDIISVNMSIEIDDTLLTTAVKDMSGVSQNDKIGSVNIILNHNQFMLINDRNQYYQYHNYAYYAESLHLLTNSKEEIETYQLIDELGRILVDEAYLPQGNSAIKIANLPEGEYYIYLNQRPIYVEDHVYEKFYSIMRNNKANQVTLYDKYGILKLNVATVDELPEDDYDILIDAGHGGMDGGTSHGGLIEAEETLKVSAYIAKRLEEHGLKVKMTRNENIDPSGDNSVDYMKAPYIREGRVEQAYQYKANYMISNHLNAFKSQNYGFEIYSSIFSNDLWSTEISNELKLSGQLAQDNMNNQFRVSEGSYKKYVLCQRQEACSAPFLDYFYIIRETGGILSQAKSLALHNENYLDTPNYGAETILIEYAYLDHHTDREKWIKDWRLFGEAVVKATLKYLDIPYNPQGVLSGSF